MRGRVQFTLAVVALAGAALAAQGQYAKVTEIPIGGGNSWDYAAVDSAGKRLYVSHATEVVVIDTATDKVVGKVPAGPGVHGIAAVPALNRFYITNGRGANPDGSLGNVSVVDAKTLETLSKVPTGLGPDAILYEPKNKEIYSLNHAGKSVTTFDAATGKVSATIPLAGVAEFGQADGDRVFVNIEDKDAIDVIDVTKHEVVAHWPVAPAESPTGMALDAANHRLFVGGGKAVVMIDNKTGKVLASAPICDGTDATAYDPVGEAGLRVVQRRQGDDRARRRAGQADGGADPGDGAAIQDDDDRSRDAQDLPGGDCTAAAGSRRGATGGGPARPRSGGRARLVQSAGVRAEVDAARRAGPTHATSDAAVTIAAAASITPGSPGRTSKSRLPIARPIAHDARARRRAPRPPGAVLPAPRA